MAGGKVKRALQVIEDALGVDLPDLEVKVAKAARSEAKSTPSTLAVEPPKSAPRRRVKPKVRLIRPDPEDADPDKWLQRAREEAAERYGSYNRLAGKTTASVKGRVELDPQKLVDVPGAMGERRVPGDEKYDRLMASVQEKGFDPNTHIWLGVNHLGEPYVAEGNTRLAVARDLGIQRIPAEVMWYGGGEGVEGPMMPELLEKYMPPSELALDPNFRRWFGNSKVVDKYGEPVSVYHGTADDFNAFSDTKIGKGDPGFLGRGFYFADNPYVAETYSRLRPGPQERVIEAYLSLQNPFNWGAKGLGVRGFVQGDARLPEPIHDEIARRTGITSRVPFEDQPYAERDAALAVRELLESMGHDSVIATDDFSSKPIEYVAFRPTQIKSATGNRGTYDPNDPDIRKARGGLAVKRKRKK